MSKAILVSKDYGMFDMHAFNRPLNRRHITGIRKSMEKYGWIWAEPMMTKKIGEKSFKIIRGHHRFCAAKELGIPVKYVVVTETPQIFEMESTVRPWSCSEYLGYYVLKEFPLYQELNKYIEETGFGVSVAIRIMTGDDKDAMVRFKLGRFQFTEAGKKRAARLSELSLETQKAGAKFYKTSNYIRALINMIAIDEFEDKEYIKKMKKFPSLLTKQISLNGYLDMIATLYNTHRRGRDIPLAFLATNAAKDRQSSFVKKT